MGAELVPAAQGSALIRLLKSLLGIGPGVHRSIRWDSYGRCDRAICSVCDTEIGVSIKDHMAEHGPRRSPCPGSGGGTDTPRQGPGNAAASIRARNQAVSGRRRSRRRR